MRIYQELGKSLWLFLLRYFQDTMHLMITCFLLHSEYSLSVRKVVSQCPNSLSLRWGKGLLGYLTEDMKNVHMDLQCLICCV